MTPPNTGDWRLEAYLFENFDVVQLSGDRPWVGLKEIRNFIASQWMQPNQRTSQIKSHVKAVVLLNLKTEKYRVLKVERVTFGANITKLHLQKEAHATLDAAVAYTVLT